MVKKSSVTSSIPVCPQFEKAGVLIKPLGRPTAEFKSLGSPGDYAILQFQFGWMLYLPFGEKAIQVLFELPNKTWRSFVDNYRDEDVRHQDSCPDLREPGGNLKKPIRGFGKIWCGEGGLTEDERKRIGWGLTSMFGPRENSHPEDTLYYQEFEKGKIFGGRPLQPQYVSGVSGIVIFVLYNNGTWEMTGRN